MGTSADRVEIGGGPLLISIVASRALALLDSLRCGADNVDHHAGVGEHGHMTTVCEVRRSQPL